MPEDLDRIVLACLEKVPEKRPDSALELLRMLGASSVANRWTARDAEKWWRDHAPAGCQEQ